MVFYDTRQEAIDAGKAKASRDQVELLIHGLDGRVCERNTYGHNPRHIWDSYTRNPPSM
ncbi:DUF2188 domain-containing protein [Cupriavidus basilensis]